MTVVIVALQYLLGPAIVGWTMKVKYVSPDEQPELHRLVQELATAARIPVPRVGVSGLPIPNAFAFGRWRKDGRVVVTEKLMKMLDRNELRAVLGHEIMHLRNRDVAVITFLSLLPNIYFLLRIGCGRVAATRWAPCSRCSPSSSTSCCSSSCSTSRASASTRPTRAR